MFAEIKNIKANRLELKKFGWLVGGVLVLIGLVQYYFGNPLNTYFIVGGAILVVAGFVVPIILKPLYLLWMAIAVVLGWFMTRLILIVLFYLVLTPISFVSWLFGKKFMGAGIDHSVETYWTKREITADDAASCEKQY